MKPYYWRLTSLTSWQIYQLYNLNVVTASASTSKEKFQISVNRFQGIKNTALKIISASNFQTRFYHSFCPPSEFKWRKLQQIIKSEISKHIIIYKMYSMKNTLTYNFNYRIAAMLCGQMIASHSHFYFDDEELQQHECTMQRRRHHSCNECPVPLYIINDSVQGFQSVHIYPTTASRFWQQGQDPID